MALISAYVHVREWWKWCHPATQFLVWELCSPRSAIVHRSSVFGFHPLPASSWSVTKLQAVPLSWVFSVMRLFSPAPYFWRTVALTHSAPLWEGLMEQWPNTGCTQECLWDPAAASAPRLQPGASPPQKKFVRQCSSSVSGIMENHNTQALGFTFNDLVPAAANLVILCGLLGPGCLTASTKWPSSSGSAFLCVAWETPGLHSVPRDSPFPPEHHQVSSYGVADSVLPLFTVLMEFKSSPFSFLPF